MDTDLPWRLAQAASATGASSASAPASAADAAAAVRASAAFKPRAVTNTVLRNNTLKVRGYFMLRGVSPLAWRGVGGVVVEGKGSVQNKLQLAVFCGRCVNAPCISVGHGCHLAINCDEQQKGACG